MTPEILATIKTLEERRYHIDLAIQALRRLAPDGAAAGTEVVPTDRPTDRPTDQGGLQPRRAARRPARRAGPDDDAGATDDGAGELATRLMQALGTHGALSTGDLTAKAKGGRKPVVRTLMLQLATKGLVHSTGTHRSQRWHLGSKGSKSPKEAESRGR